MVVCCTMVHTHLLAQPSLGTQQAVDIAVPRDAARPVVAQPDVHGPFQLQDATFSVIACSDRARAAGDAARPVVAQPNGHRLLELRVATQMRQFFPISSFSVRWWARPRPVMAQPNVRRPLEVHMTKGNLFAASQVLVFATGMQRPAVVDQPNAHELVELRRVTNEYK